MIFKILDKSANQIRSIETLLKTVVQKCQNNRAEGKATTIHEFTKESTTERHSFLA